MGQHYGTTSAPYNACLNPTEEEQPAQSLCCGLVPCPGPSLLHPLGLPAPSLCGAGGPARRSWSAGRRTSCRRRSLPRLKRPCWASWRCAAASSHRARRAACSASTSCSAPPVRGAPSPLPPPLLHIASCIVVAPVPVLFSTASEWHALPLPSFTLLLAPLLRLCL